MPFDAKVTQRAWIEPGIQPRSVSRMLTKKDVPIPLTRKTASGGRRMAQTTSTSVVKTPPILAGRGKQIGMKKKSNLALY